MADCPQGPEAEQHRGPVRLHPQDPRFWPRQISRQGYTHSWFTPPGSSFFLAWLVKTSYNSISGQKGGRAPIFDVKSFFSKYLLKKYSS